MQTETGVSLKPYNSFGLPAVAQTLVRIRSDADVRRVVDDPELGRAPKFILGGGSNIILTRDMPQTVLKVEVMRHPAGRGARRCLDRRGRRRRVVARAS